MERKQAAGNLPTTVCLHAIGAVDCWLACSYATCTSFCIFSLVAFERAIGDPIWIWNRFAFAFGRVAVIIHAADAAGATEACTT